MKNEFLILVVFFISFFISNISKGEEFQLDSKVIKISKDGNIIKAEGEVEIKTDNKLL